MNALTRALAWLNLRLGLESWVTRQLLQRALLIGGMASIVVSAYQSFDTYRQQQTELREHLDAIANYVTPALVESLWAFNDAQTHTQLAGLIHEKSVSAVVLKQPDLPDQRHGRPRLSPHTLERVVPLSHTENGKTHPLGTLHLLHDLEEDYRQLLDHMVLSSLGNAVVILLVILISLITYHTFVQQRLAAIVAELSHTGPQDLIATSQDTTPRKPARDEIDELTHAIVQLKAKGGAALALLEQKNQTLQETLDELTQAKRLLRTVIDTAPVRIFWKDRHSRYLGCNRLFAQDAGTSSPQSLVGQTDDDMTWVAQADLYRADDRAVMETLKPNIGYEEPQTRPDGGTAWLRTSKVPMLDDAGQAVGVVGVYDDITRHKEAERQLAEQLDELLRWQDLMLDREDRILELKGEVNVLLARLGEPSRYDHTLPITAPPP
ncbi:PAS domain-containing protein [Vitreoscilla filiformis]|nr:PAS domain-containing protein [Vitreoscilla filiformis]